MGGEAPPVDKHAVGAGFRHFAGRFHLRPVGVAVAPERCPPRLIEIFHNVAREESKFGFFTEETEDACREISKMPGIRVKGLMTSAPFVENAEDNRKYFKKLYELAVDIQSKNIDNISMRELSMGMTGDYVVAVEEGATIVRVGTGIFGSR